MRPGTENQVKRSTASVPGEQYGPGLAGRTRQQVPATSRDVMDTLLGRNNLAAYDASGTDPYNTTGKFFRR